MLVGESYVEDVDKGFGEMIVQPKLVLYGEMEEDLRPNVFHPFHDTINRGNPNEVKTGSFSQYLMTLIEKADCFPGR